MARPKKNILTASKVFHGGCWRLIVGRTPHRADFSIRHLTPTDNPRLAEAEAEKLRLELMAARARNTWPDWATKIAAVRRVIAAESAARLNGPNTAKNDTAPTIDIARLYDRYAKQIAGEADPSWCATQLAFIRELADTQGVSLSEAKPTHVQAYLNHVIRTPGPATARVHARAVAKWRRDRIRIGIDPDTGKSLPAGYHKPSGPSPKKVSDEPPAHPAPRTIATRNQALRSLRKFYQWAIRECAVATDPTDGIRKLTEPPPDEVIVLTHWERELILEVASDHPEGIAVAIALYAGLRRSEIIRSEWRHYRLDRKNVRVPRHKRGGENTPRIRTVPLASRLVDWLAKTPENKRSGYVVNWGDTLNARRKAAGCLMDYIATHPKLANIDRKKFGWNVLRHTFCTGHLDAGVATGIVCQWSGHTEKVFWTNYAGHIREYDDRINMIDDQQTKIT